MPTKLCPRCKNKSSLPCTVCGKRREDYLFIAHCEKQETEFLTRTHSLLIRYKMESTGSPDLDLSVLDKCGIWLQKLPAENPLCYIYEKKRHSTVLRLHHIFKFTGIKKPEFMEQYRTYLETKRAEIDAMIAQNKISFVP